MMRKQQGKGRVAEDLTGRRFGKLIILETTELRIGGSTVFTARCDCGQEIKVSRQNLRTWETSKYEPHCGCMGVGKARIPRPGTLGVGRAGARTAPRPNWQAACNFLFLQYQHSAKIRGITWHLSREEFTKLTKENCYYCGIQPGQIITTRNGYHTYIYNGIDRFNNDEPYIVDNCISCCGTCNVAKGSKTVIEFKLWLQRIVKHWLEADTE